MPKDFLVESGSVSVFRCYKRVRVSDKTKIIFMLIFGIYFFKKMYPNSPYLYDT